MKTKWSKDVVTHTKDGVTIVDVVDADPAADPEVQREVIEALLEEYSKIPEDPLQEIKPDFMTWLRLRWMWLTQVEEPK